MIAARIRRVLISFFPFASTSGAMAEHLGFAKQLSAQGSYRSPEAHRGGPVPGGKLTSVRSQLDGHFLQLWSPSAVPSAPAQQRSSLLDHYRREDEIADHRKRQRCQRHPNPLLRRRLHGLVPRSSNYASASAGRGQEVNTQRRPIGEGWRRLTRWSVGLVAQRAGRTQRKTAADVLSATVPR